MILLSTDNPGYNNSGVAQSVYYYTANIVIAMIIIMAVVRGLHRHCIVLANILIANIVMARAVCT